VNSLFLNTTGNSNTALGDAAGINLTTGSSNIALGAEAGINLTTGSNNIDIGNAGVAGESNRIRIGTAGIQTKTFIAGIRGVTTQNADAIPVMIDSAGQLGTMS
jgi:trimeric autotransporter adhesin